MLVLAIVAAIALAEAIAVVAIVPARGPVVAARPRAAIEVKARAVAVAPSRQPTVPLVEVRVITRWATSHRAAPPVLNHPAAEPAMRAWEAAADAARFLRADVAAEEVADSAAAVAEEAAAAAVAAGDPIFG